MNTSADMGCLEVQKLVHAYLDMEFEAGERALLERHVQHCDGCRKLVGFESSFKSNLRTRLRRPAAPPELRDRIRQALDRADAAGEGPVPKLWRRAAPLAATAAAAAAVVIFLGTFVTSRADSPIVEDAIRTHVKNLPVEVDGSEDRVRSFFTNRVPVPVRPPHLRAADASLVGARIGQLRGHDAAQLVYRVHQSPVTVHIFDPSDMPQSFGRRRVVDHQEVFVDGARGYSVVYLQDRGVGYAFTSDLDEEEMVQLVSTSLR